VAKIERPSIDCWLNKSTTCITANEKTFRQDGYLMFDSIPALFFLFDETKRRVARNVLHRYHSRFDSSPHAAQNRGNEVACHPAVIRQI